MNADAGTPRSQSDATEQGPTYLFPCSIVQRSCWYLDQLSPNASLFNIAVRFILRGELSVQILEESFRQIIARHDVLRTRFIVDEGEPKQLVESTIRFTVTRHDLRHMPESERTEEAERMAVEEAAKPFDIRTGPLFRASLLRVAENRHILLLTIHHIIADGWSVGVITDELGEAYGALRNGTQPKLPELSLQYGDYACWQLDWIKSEEFNRSLEHLKSKLDGFPSLSIPTDYPRPIAPEAKGEIRSILLPISLTDQLQKLAERQGCTLFVVMYSALLALLHRHSESDDVVIRTQTSGRDQLEIEPLVGWFVNSIVLRTKIPENASFQTLVEVARAEVLGGLEHQNVPFERLMDVIRPKQESFRQPPFQVNFIFQRDFVRPWSAGGLQLVPIPSKSTGPFVDLNMFLVKREDGWRCSIEVNTSVFEAETGDYFLEAYRNVLEAVAENPAIRMSRIPMAPRRRNASTKPALADLSFNNHVPPRNDSERAVIEIFERILGFREIGAYTNFFDLGGHSLLAVRLLDELRKQLGRTVDLATLFVDPTPAAMARIIMGEEAYSDPRQIIPVQPAGDRPPFFMIGGDHWFRPLALKLGYDQPFIGIPLLRFRSLDHGEQRLSIAKEVADLIKEEYGDIPYILGGWCADGLTALEVGRALQAGGSRVSAVVLFDAMNPEYYRQARALVHSAGRTATSLRGILRKRTGQSTLSALSEIILALNGVTKRVFKRIFETFSSPYSCLDVDFPLIVVRPPIGSLEEPALGWNAVAKQGLTVIDTPGDHSSIFKEPYVHELGLRLRKQLDLVIGVGVDTGRSGTTDR